MNILIVVGQDLLENNSANLCHMAYLKGFIDMGCNIDVLTTINSNKSISLPQGAKYYQYKPVRFYHNYYRKLFSSDDVSNQNRNDCEEQLPVKSSYIKKYIVRFIKYLLSLRSPYATAMVWAKNAMKFKSDKEYDLVLSLSWPSISHYTVNKLLNSKKIRFKKWCQLWEDPWYSDLYGEKKTKIEKAESKLLDNDCKIIYVTPGTLENQKHKFKRNANKMDWLPLPSYYSKQYPCTNNKKIRYAYFGDYFFSVRNLNPFYQAANLAKLDTYICGNSDRAFESTNEIAVMPRLQLNELEKYENETDVLVFIANLGGGQIPGKIYQYSATNKPILFILDGDEYEKQVLKDYFGQFNRYVFCENNVEDIYRSISIIESGKYDNIINEPVVAFQPYQIAKSIIEKCTSC